MQEPLLKQRTVNFSSDWRYVNIANADNSSKDLVFLKIQLF